MRIIPGAEIPYLGTYAWANRPAASSNSGSTFFCSDVGNGIFLYSDGLVWRGLTGDWITLFQGGVPVGIPSSGSVGNNGALSGITEFSTQFPAAYLYFPADKIAVGVPAGLYFCVMSSTTAGTIYNNTYSGGNPAIPASPTPFSTTGPGAYTQSTSEITLLSPGNLPGGLMGINSALLVDSRFSSLSGAGTKSMAVKLGNTLIGTATTITATIRQMAFRRTVHNAGVANRQSILNFSTWSADTVFSSGGNTGYAAIDTSADQALTLTGTIANAADWLILESYQFAVSPRG